MMFFDKSQLLDFPTSITVTGPWTIIQWLISRASGWLSHKFELQFNKATKNYLLICIQACITMDYGLS